MPSKGAPSSLWPQYISASVLVVSIFAAISRVALLGWTDPYHCHSLLNRGKWLDKSFQNWQPENCMMHKYSPKDVNSCLTTKRIIFIGDSVTRQLFFSMVHLADPELPSAPPTSFEKHSDHSFPSGTGTSFDFFWDPFLNSTKTAKLLERGGYGERETPGLLVIGSGLWFLRYAESTGGISAWEATIERTLDLISKAGPSFADEIVILPVQEPDESKLSPERAVLINNADIDAMNSDLIHRLSPEAPNFNDREIAHEVNSYYELHSPLNSAPVVRIMFPSVFNKLLDPSLTEDGLHYNETITAYQAQILLNLRCNDALPKVYPLDKTCCSKYPRTPLIQVLALAALVLYGPLAFLFQRRLPNDVWTARIFPRDEFVAPISIFGSAVGLCFVADRTGLWLKEQKQFDAIAFASLCFLALIAGLLTVHRGGKDLGFLNREQTNEWKGWMQLAILIYHYLGGSKISGIYGPIRVLVASYLFMTGYGHTTYYLKKADFSFQRVAQILIRLNLLTVALAYAMNTDYLFYYFAPLVSFWYLIVYATLFLGSQYNEKPIFLLGKIAVSAAAVASLHATPVPLETLFRFLELICNIRWSASEWCFRVNLDILIVYVGMIAAAVYGKSRELRLTDHPKWPWIHHGVLTACGLGLVWFLAFELSRQDKFAYNDVHPFVSLIPVVGFALLRNATPVLRAASSRFFAFIGACSLETYILQYHIWLAGDTKGILIVVPGVSWRPFNLVVTSIVFIWVSHNAANATGELTRMFCGVKSTDLPITSTATDVGLSVASTAPRRHEAGQDTINEESIPLVEPAFSVLSGTTNEHPEKLGAIQAETPIVGDSGSNHSAQSPRADGSGSAVSPIRPHPQQPPSLPIRMAGLLAVLWIVNLVWLYTAPYI